MRCNCPKHGIYYPAINMTAADCPQCERERPKATQALKDLVREYGGYSTPTPDPAAVIAALEPFAAEAERMEPDGRCDEIGDSVEIWQVGREKYRRSRITYGDLRRAAAAVRSYRASRQPQGVRPEEVPPGTRFRFCNPHNGAVDDGSPVYVLALDDEGYRWAVDERAWRTFRPDSDSAIIPLDQPDA